MFLDSLLPPVILHQPVVQGIIAKASWSHSYLNMTQFYRVRLDGKIVGQVKDLKMLIDLSNCNQRYSLQVDAIDICNNISIGQPVNFLCPRTSKDSINIF